MILRSPNLFGRSRLTRPLLLRLPRLHLLWLLMILAMCCLAPFSLWAQAPDSTPKPAEAGRKSSREAPEFWQNRGHWTFGFQVGYAVENAIPRNISHINLLIAQPQVGVIAHQFHRGPVSRFEILGEGIVGNSVHPGGHLLGTSLFFRFDGNPHGRFVPFFDAGAGVLHTTLSTRAPELSGNLQFLPQGGLGVHYFIRPQRALIFEYRYVHMSNAGIEPPNHGFNASMITIGFRWLRRP